MADNGLRDFGGGLRESDDVRESGDGLREMGSDSLRHEA